MAEVALRQQERRDALVGLAGAAHEAHIAKLNCEHDPVKRRGWHAGFDVDAQTEIPLAAMPVDPSVHRTAVQS